MSGNKVGILTGEFLAWSLKAKDPASPSSHRLQGSLLSERHHPADGLAGVPGLKGPFSPPPSSLLQQAPASGNIAPGMPESSNTSGIYWLTEHQPCPKHCTGGSKCLEKILDLRQPNIQPGRMESAMTEGVRTDIPQKRHSERGR